MPRLADRNQKRTVKKFELRLRLNPKRILLWVLGIFFGIWFLTALLPLSPVGEEIPLSQALNDIKDGRVEEIVVEEERIILHYPDKTSISTKEKGESMTDLLEKAGVDPSAVKLKIKSLSPSRFISSLLEIGVPILFTIGLFYFLSRQAGKAQDVLFSFGKSRARRFAKGKQRITFADVGGVEEAKKELEEVVDFLKNPKKYRRLGARTPKGVLLLGPSGVGKTLLAKAVAGEANVPFFSMAGSEFMEMLVGVGASRTRDLFSTAKRSAPSIIFIDELDAIGGMRGLGIVGGHREQEQTLNQILVEMDGFTANDHVIVLSASVTGETPILIRKKGEIKLLSISNFVDKFYQEEEEGEKELEDVQTLGFEKKIYSGNFNKGNVYFGHSAFKKIRSVFRHKVKEVYEIEYLGGKLRATGNHSVFVRTSRGIETKAVRELVKGDVLVALLMKINRTTKARRRICTYKFSPKWKLTLPVYSRKEDEIWEGKYLYALENAGLLPQAEIASEIGVAQTTISLWQGGINGPRALSRKYFKHQLPETVEITPGLMRLFGYYVAEGYARKEVDFCFNIEESEMIKDLIRLMEKIFGLKPDAIRRITPGAVNIIYYSRPLASFFKRYCGTGAKNKHVPSFLFEAPFDYFREFLRGVFKGDGYRDKKGTGEITSVSRQLILELNWLAAMHGIKTYVSSFTAKNGRRIKNGKPLKPTVAYRLGWGKSVDPFGNVDRKRAPWRRAIVKSVKKLSYDGFVYDLCGCENEAFFGGERPVLLHNTNRPDMLDPALTRPGRFDRRIVLDMPDLNERKKILLIHSQGKPFREVDWDKAAKRTVGFSGADLENMLNEAAILAARNNKKAIDMDDIEEAATKVKLGPEKKRLQSPQEKKMTAYHEAGHAAVAHFMPTMDPVHRVSIVSRGLALGFTLIPPEKDKYTETKTELLEKIGALLGGRAAEELVFQEFTGGAASDISQATMIVRQMVIEYGMSDLGPIYFGPQLEKMEWGGSIIRPQELSDEMQAKVDGEIKKIIDSCYDQAKEILKKQKKKLDLIAKKLIEQETIEGGEFAKLMGPRKKKV